MTVNRIVGVYAVSGNVAELLHETHVPLNHSRYGTSAAYLR